MKPRALNNAVAVLVALMLTGCELKTGVAVPPDSGTGGLNESVGATTAAWVVLDLTTGASEGRETIPDLATNMQYRRSKLVLRRITAKAATIGSASSDRWALGDEPRTTVTPSSYLIGAFELTRGQWRYLAKSTPWRLVVPEALAGLAEDDDLPLCGASLDQIRTACAEWRLPGHLVVPTAEQWEVACRGGSATIFSWGAAVDTDTVSRFAVVRQTAAGDSGPHPVGERQANSFGLYDMHGNVWEWTKDSQIRGGSWHDALPLARSANHLALDQTTPYALAGVRLVYVP